MKHLLLTATLATGLLSPLTAQDFYVPDNAPSGGCNVIPFGVNTVSTTWSNQIYQTMATAADLGNSAVLNICDLSFISCGTGLQVNSYDSIEITLGQTNATTLSSTFSANLVSNVQTVLVAKNFHWHNYGAQFSRIGLQKDYLYIAAQGANLVVQICVTNGRKLVGGTTGHYTGARQRLYNFGWTGSVCPTTGTVGSSAALKWGIHARTAGLTEFGTWCSGTNGNAALTLGGSAQLGQNLSINLASAPATRPAWLVIGVAEIPGGFDLSLIGATGCYQYVSPAIVLGLATSGTGTHSLGATVPNNAAIICARIYAQYFINDNGANSANLTTTNYGRIMPGN